MAKWQLTNLTTDGKMLSVAFVALIVVFFMVIWPALSGPFLFDDFSNLNNLKIINGDVSADNIGRYIAAFTGTPGRPLSAISFLINDNNWPSDPSSFKYTNALIHLLNGILVFALLRALSKISGCLPKNEYWPLVAAGAWLLHPFLISSQMLIVQRMTLLSATFSLVGLILYVGCIQKIKNTFDALKAIILLTFFSILAFLCKESGALLPALALILNITLLNSFLNEKPSSIKRILNLVCFATFLVVAIAVILIGVMPGAYEFREYSLYERLLTQSHILINYIQLILIPKLSGGGIYNDDYITVHSLTENLVTIPYILMILGSITASLLLRLKYPILAFSILWFFIGHVIESTFLPLEMYFEHRNYLPIIGIVAGITSMPFMFGQYKKLFFTILFLWILFLTTILSIQAKAWGDHKLLATVWANDHPQSLRANQELASAYIKENPLKSTAILMTAYENGIKKPDLPLRALYLACLGVDSTYKQPLPQIAKSSLKNDSFSLGTITIMQELRVLVLKRKCDTYFNGSMWLSLTDTLLINPKYNNSERFKINVERAAYFKSHDNLEGSISELKKAYELNPKIELTQMIAFNYIDNNECVKASEWLNRGLSLPMNYFKSYLSKTAENSESIIALISNGSIPSCKSS
jgi:protein O-mannosyl-transferase